MDKKVALIAGASSGIGAASAEQLAKDGFNLAIAARRQAKLEEVADKCRAHGAEVLILPTDMTKEDEVNHMLTTTKENFGKIDFFFANQGVLQTPKVFEESTLDDLYQMVEANLKTAFLALTKSIPIFKEQGYGNILVTGSSSGLRPESGYAVYSTTKHAVVGMVKAAAMECGQFNIRINCLCPGGVETPMTANTKEQIAEAGGFSKVMRRPASICLPGRLMAKVDEVVGMVSFMASDKSTFMQGSVISIDGGITL